MFEIEREGSYFVNIESNECLPFYMDDDQKKQIVEVILQLEL